MRSEPATGERDRDGVRPRRRIFRRVLLAIGVLLLLLMGATFLFREALTQRMLFHPERGQSRTPAALDLPYAEVWLTASDGVRTHAWWIPAADDSPVVVFFHGNGGTIAGWLDIALPLRELGVSIMLAEYRGYGDSEGTPSEQGLYADAGAAVLEARRRAAGRKVFVSGVSLGGAVAIDVATKVPVDGLIVSSTFTSLPDMARTITHLPFAGAFVAYRFDSLSKIRRVDCPILILHGDADELVPFSMGERLRDAATRAPVVRFHRVAGGRHNDTWTAGGAPYWHAWRELLEGR